MKLKSRLSTKYSDYIIYVDESGDPNPNSLDANYPIFALAFCIFKKSVYSSLVSPMMQDLKFEFFGHDTIILHENELRRRQPPFNVLYTRNHYEAFMKKLAGILQNAPMNIIATVTDKREKITNVENLYNHALQNILTQVQIFLKSVNQQDKLTHIVIEKRGDKEDKELELEFRRICDENSFDNLDIIFVSKKVNSSGLQLADMVARPIGLNILKPNQANRAYEIIKTKFFKKDRLTVLPKKRKTSEN